MAPEPQTMLSEIRRRGEQHAKSRRERWRRLGLAPSLLRAQSVLGPRAVGLPRVSIILATHRVERIEACQRNIAAQNYPNLEVIIVLNNDAYDETSVQELFAGMRDLQILRVPSFRNLGTCINLGVTHATGAYIAKMDDDDFYGPSYISDLVLAALESGADITGKKAAFYFFEDGQEYCFRGAAFRNRWLWPLTHERGHTICSDSISTYCSTVAGASLLVARDVIRRIPFDEAAPRGTDTIFQLACRRAGFTTYVSDEFNFCYVRHACVQQHLWQKAKSDILTDSIPLSGFELSQLCI